MDKDKDEEMNSKLGQSVTKGMRRVYSCATCGGALRYGRNDGFFECKFCGTMQSVELDLLSPKFCLMNLYDAYEVNSLVELAQKKEQEDNVKALRDPMLLFFKERDNLEHNYMYKSYKSIVEGEAIILESEPLREKYQKEVNKHQKKYNAFSSIYRTNVVSSRMYMIMTVVATICIFIGFGFVGGEEPNTASVGAVFLASGILAVIVAIFYGISSNYFASISEIQKNGRDYDYKITKEMVDSKKSQLYKAKDNLFAVTERINRASESIAQAKEDIPRLEKKIMASEEDIEAIDAE